MKPAIKVPALIFLLSQTSWIISFGLSKLNLLKEQIAVFIAGILALTAVTIVPYFIIRGYLKRTDPFILNAPWMKKIIASYAHPWSESTPASLLIFFMMLNYCFSWFKEPIPCPNALEIKELEYFYAFVLVKWIKKALSIGTALSAFCWTCVLGLVIGLEIDGYITDFMGFYFVEGEPYLYTAHGAIICYWDGIVHFVLGMVVITLYCHNRSYRDVALYWIGSILNSMIVLLPGAIAGNSPFKLSILLNTPYLILPLLAGFKLLHERPYQIISLHKFESIWKRPIDLLFFLYFIGALLFSLFRGLAVLNGNAVLMKEYVKAYEPYLADVSNFPKFQMLAYGYFYLVYYLAAAYGLLYPGQNWMIDWSIIHAGAIAQGQFSYIAGSFHHRTPASLRSPTEGFPALIFWTLNLVLLLVPQVFVWWCKQNTDLYGFRIQRKEKKVKSLSSPKKVN